MAQTARLTSCSGRFQLVMQPDGNLVLYDGTPVPNNALWATHTNSATVATMQSGGNFVLQDASAKQLWSSGTGGNPGAYLHLQDDGNLVVSLGGSALWATGTNGCTHENGIGQTYSDCAPRGQPGDPTTYSRSMAGEAASAWGHGGGADATCGSSSCVSVFFPNFINSECAAWCYSGSLAGRVIDVIQTSSTCCPSGSDGTWN
jgi:hypothetical protein